MATIHKEPNLLIAYTGPYVGKAISSQGLSHWIVKTIKLCYLLAKRPLLGSI